MRLPSSQYWNLCGALFAYLYAGPAEQANDALGASQLLGYPTQFPSVTLLDWQTGTPNARYRVLELLHANLGPGDRMVKVALTSHNVFAAAYVSPNGERKVLPINKRGSPTDIRPPNALGAVEQHVNVGTAARGLISHSLDSDLVHLGRLSVMVVGRLPVSHR